MNTTRLQSQPDVNVSVLCQTVNFTRPGLIGCICVTSLVRIIILGYSCKNADYDETAQSESSPAVPFCKNKSLATIDVLKYCNIFHRIHLKFCARGF